MRKPGRPSLAEEDREAIVTMAEMWRAGASDYSISKLARIEAGLQQPDNSTGASIFTSACQVKGEGKPVSKAKRLERRFNKLVKQGFMKPVSVYRVRETQRHRALREYLGFGNGVVGPFSQRDLGQPHFFEANSRAVEATAEVCKLSLEEVESLAAEGLRFLKKWFPEEYREGRI